MTKEEKLSLERRLKIWQRELDTNENGMAHLADNVVFCLKERLKGNPIVSRAKNVVDKWPSWKREITLTKSSSQK